VKQDTMGMGCNPEEIQKELLDAGFTIADPSSIMGGWSYESQRRQWDYLGLRTPAVTPPPP